MQPKPAIFASSHACIARGTGSSNPSPSSGEVCKLSVPKMSASGERYGRDALGHGNLSLEEASNCGPECASVPILTSVRSEIIPGAVLTSAVLTGAEIWMNAQGEVLSVMEAAMADWMRRRREAMHTWSPSLQKMCECRNPVDFVQTQQEWLYGAIRLAT